MLTNRVNAFAALLSFALFAGAFAAAAGTTTGSFRSGERVSPPAAHAPAHVSRTLVKAVTPLAGQAAVEIPAAGGSGLIVWSIPVSAAARLSARPGGTAPPLPLSDVKSSLTTPSGRVLAAEEGGSVESGLRRFSFQSEELGLDLPESIHEVIHVTTAEAGLHRLDLKTVDDSTALLVVAAEPESPLTLSTWAGPLSRLPGEPVVLHAELKDGEGPITGARVSARLAAPGAVAGSPIELYDDGAHGDGAAGDGVYGAVVSEPGATPGLWSVRFEAEGRERHGHAFARTGSGGFVNERGAARLLPASVRGTFVAEGGERKLRVLANAHVVVAGDYRFDAIVSGPAAADGTRDGLAWGQAIVHLEEGQARLALEIPAAQIAAPPGMPLHLDVRLLGLDPMGVAGRLEIEIER